MFLIYWWEMSVEKIGAVTNPLARERGCQCVALPGAAREFPGVLGAAGEGGEGRDDEVKPSPFTMRHLQSIFSPHATPA